MRFFVFCFLTIVLAGLFSMVSFFLGEKVPDREKVSAYECGFVPFSFLGRPFSIRFFLIGILFLIFDIIYDLYIQGHILFNFLL